jgi:hypothetical protein
MFLFYDGSVLQPYKLLANLLYDNLHHTHQQLLLVIALFFIVIYPLEEWKHLQTHSEYDTKQEYCLLLETSAIFLVGSVIYDGWDSFWSKFNIFHSTRDQFDYFAIPSRVI